MKRYISKILLLFIILYSFGCTVFADGLFNGNNGDNSVYICGPDDTTNCSIDSGIKIVDDNVNGIQNQMKFSDYVQVITKYALTFVGIIAVLLIIFAGFNILTASGDEAKVKKSKSILTYVAMGLFFMFMAYSIVKFILYILNPTTIIYADNYRLPSLFDSTYAYTANDKNTFDEYKKQAEILASSLEEDYKVNSKISAINLSKLQQIVNSAITTFPDNNDYIANTNIAKNLLISIEVVKKAPDSNAKITQLAKDLNDFLNKIKIPRIAASISATPQTGDAPLNVSLRASNVVDPSGTVIPNANYIWWVKDSSGNRITLGTGPSINKTFKDEKSYLVNLDIISSSRNSNGKIDTLPFAGQIKVDVLPRAGTIYFYINGINVTDRDSLKITPNIGKAGLILDATASLPASGTRFSRTLWDFGNGNTISHELSPHIERQFYANEGNYKLSLQLLTNEGKTITKILYIEVRDPVASIKADKNSGFVGDDFKFNVNTAFYAGQLSYEWKVIDLSSNDILYTSSNENILYKFKNTGKFAVKLKSRSASGKEDIDTVIVNIDSRDPIASFETTQVNPETPNTFKLDATTSYDPDTFNSSKLNYKWLVDGQVVELENPLRNGAVGKYTFNTDGTHKITLEVSNSDGKTTSTHKTLNVNSLLSVKLGFTPKIVKIGSPVTIIADSKEAKIFEWNFGDSSTDTTNIGRISHTYKKSGTYDINLTVRGSKGTDSNNISRKVYVSDGFSPLSAISISRDNEEILPTESVCDGKEAFVIDRASAVTFSAENSVNVDGNTSGLVYSWKYVGRNSSQSRFSYKFDELGCFPVDLTVKSQKNGKLNKTRVFIRVDNLSPKLSGLTLTPTDTNADPVVVKVSANNAHDDDGVIVSYLWYYHTDSDPEPQDYRITRVPSTTFVLPKITGKYYFVLIAEDSNGAKVNTDESSEEKYSLQLTTDNINTPLIKLTADKTAISTGDEVNFIVKVSDVLSRDISDKVEYKWDFDGDGFYDETTKTGKMTHKFITSGNINFKVKVTYKGISNTKFQLISVANVLKPNFEYYAVGNKLILFNTSEGNYTNATWDLGNDITSTNLNSFTYDFSNEDFPSNVSLVISDGSSSKSISIPVKKDVVNKLRISKSNSNLVLFAYPSINKDTIHVANSNDKLFLYLGESKGKVSAYCIDSDVSTDTDLNGTADDDCDNKGSDSYTSGTPFVISDFNTSSRDIKITLFNGKNILETKKLSVVQDGITTNGDGEVITGDNKSISEADRLSIEELKDLIKKTPEKDRLQLMKFLSSLQENWFDDREKTKVIIDFETYIASSSFDIKIKENFVNLLDGFLVSDNQSKTEVALAVKVLKSLIPKTNKNYAQIIKNIDEILSHPTNTNLNKELGTFILDSIKDDSNISTKDKNIIKSQLLVIIYGSQDKIPVEKKDTENTQSSFSIVNFLLSVLKIFGYILLLIIIGFGGMYVFFRMTNKNDNLSYQDFLIELFTGQKHVDNPSDEVKFDISQKSQPSEKMLDNITTKEEEVILPEPQKQEDSFISTKVADFDKKNLFQTLDSGTNTENQLPDWLKGVSQDEIIQDISTTAENSDLIESNIDIDDTIISPDINISTDDNSVAGENTSIDNIDMKASPKEIADNISEVSEGENDLPAWLKGIDQEELNNELNEELNSDDDGRNIEAPIEDEETIEDLVNKEEENLESNIFEDVSKSNNSLIIEPQAELLQEENDGLPDWLRGSAVPTIEEQNIPKNSSVKKEIKKPVEKKKIQPKSTNSSPNIKDKKQIKETPTSPKNDTKDNSIKDIKSVKPLSKKPKMFTDKKPEKILKETSQVSDDDLPDWLK